MAADLDQTCVNTIRFLSVDMVQKANSGHPGLPLGAAPMAYVLWTKFLKHHPSNPHWVDRDRFVLSAGHGSALQYSLLYLTGYDLSLDDIKQFRQWGSKTPGHPERGHTAGVETTTGPLGQGMANVVGMAMAEAQLAARYNRDGHKVVDHHTYAIVSDGDLMEGVASEAASLAGHLKLGKLICLYDDNYLTLAAGTDITFTENRAARFKAYVWHVQTIEDGNDLDAIEKAIKRAKGKKDQPSLILVRTHIGYGSPLQDSFKAHGSPLGADNVVATKKKLGWPEQPAFLIPEAALAHFREAQKKGKGAEAGWKRRWNKYAKVFPELAAELQGSLDGKLPVGWDAGIPVFPADAKGMATRVAGGKVLSAIAPKLPAVSGGSADLDPSTHTAVAGLGVFSPGKEPDEQGSPDEVWSYAGRNLHFGVREHAMGA
ncbi:MAG: transketolase, partial [Xanthomonadaceae bacterium]|nr:transketolase [Xanthomonadaceae bacterium]